MEKLSYPWIAPVLERLPKQAANLPRALLLAGPAGLGKRETALYLVRALLCETRRPSLEPCGTCASCLLLDAGNHPDVRVLEVGQPEEGGDPAAAEEEPATGGKKPPRQISVDRVRTLMDFVSITAHRGGAKVVCIMPAEAMHPSAANAVLKILEEPPGETRFILVSHRAERLLPTIRSRCFRLDFALPDTGPALAWLKQAGVDNAELALAQAGYAPLAAKDRAGDAAFWNSRKALLDSLAERSFDPLRSADAAEDIEPAVAFEILAHWAYDIAALQAGRHARYHRDYDAALQKAARAVAATDLMQWNDALLRYGRAAQHPLNKRLALESLLSAYPRT